MSGLPCDRCGWFRDHGCTCHSGVTVAEVTARHRAALRRALPPSPPPTIQDAANPEIDAQRPNRDAPRPQQRAQPGRPSLDELIAHTIRGTRRAA